MISKNIRVSGRVQGVFFRVSTQEQANLLGIKGWVKNEPDGSVLIHAESENAQKMQEFIDWCRKGSNMSKVQLVEEETSKGENAVRFEIIR